MVGVRHRGRRGGFTLIELMVVVVILGVLAAAASPIYTGQVRRARTSEAVAGLGAIRSLQILHRMEKGAFLAVSPGAIAHLPTDPEPGLGLDFSMNAYFGNACYGVVLDGTYGFVATCDGGADGNTAPRAGDVARAVVQMRADGAIRISHDGGASFSNWE